jgi:Domain of unknown function (DUF4352)
MRPPVEQRLCQNAYGLIRAPLWLIGLLIVAAIAVGIYAYFTAPLPLGLSGVVRTPGGARVGAAPAVSGTPGSARAPAGQPLALGAATVAVQSIQRNQDLTTGERGGPAGVFTLVEIQLSNAGTEPLAPSLSDFRLVDDQNRTYVVDPEATRAINAFAHRRNLVDAGVPPDGALATYLAFATTANTNPVSLRVTLGYGELTLSSQ